MSVIELDTQPISCRARKGDAETGIIHVDSAESIHVVSGLGDWDPVWLAMDEIEHTKLER